MKLRNSKFVEMSLIDFLKDYPELARMFPIDLKELASDESYRIRLSDNGRIELGYLEDDWLVK